MLNTLTFGDPDLPRLLIVHGLFGSARNWGVIAKRLSDQFHVIVPDLRNHGQSPWHDSHSYHDLASDLAPLAEGALVVGHSMGGKAAMVLALSQPGLVRRLVVADIAPATYTHDQLDNIAAMRAVDLSTVTRRSDAAAQLQVDPSLRDFFLQSLDTQARSWRLNLDTLEAEMPKILGFPDIAGVYDGDTLFLSGSQSDYVQHAHRHRIKALFPAARFAKIPGAGHWLHAEKPREFEAVLRTFLANT